MSGPLGFDDDESPAEAAARRERQAGRRRAEAAAEREPRRQPTGLLSGAAGQYGWFVGIVGILIVVLVAVSTLSGEGPGSRGVATGGPAPPFAAPLATSALAEAENHDVNVATKRGQGDAGTVPACSVRSPEVLNACALWADKPVVLAFFAIRSETCVQQLDRLDDLARLHPEVAFAAVSIKGDLGDLRSIVRDRRWSFPVGWDDDGILANAYGVAVCPQIAFVAKGGAVRDTTFGEVGALCLEGKIRRLEGRPATGPSGCGTAER